MAKAFQFPPKSYEYPMGKRVGKSVRNGSCRWKNGSLRGTYENKKVSGVIRNPKFFPQRIAPNRKSSWIKLGWLGWAGQVGDSTTIGTALNQLAKYPIIFELYHASPLLEAIEKNPEDLKVLADQFSWINTSLGNWSYIFLRALELKVKLIGKEKGEWNYEEMLREIWNWKSEKEIF